ncbi:hypothetical protein A9R05_42865 (plasmid) [Burkholderia sp. KK1]|uniref:hypothetical protein n=1 Tax=Burkholderia TaxID=32008 RepID=UPI0009799302|nr:MULTISPECIES: hypothetical protein [Burkholderia]AQH05762.1 hypothetical protein A9R05_42865 [Burkholderia sp. KK1]
MKVYAPNTDKGRTVAVDDVHRREADQPRSHARAAAKSLRHAARQHAARSIEKLLDGVSFDLPEGK